MSNYVIEIKTNKDLGSESFVRHLITEWRTNLDERLRPEFFDLGEPVRRSFASEGVEAAIETWVAEGMSLYLRRRSKPKSLIAIEWFRREKGLDPRLFPWAVGVVLNRSAGDDLALEQLRFLIHWFEPAFGSITREDDEREKHFLTFQDIGGETEMYIGQDILEKEQTLPGLYWVTYFGPWAVEKIGKERFAGLKAERVESIAGGYLVRAYNSSSEIGSRHAREVETQLINRLGKPHFFDKASVDIEALKTTPEEAAVVEEKIRELKAEKSRAN